MKKLLMIGTLCLILVAYAGTASADWGFSGTCELETMTLYWATLSGTDVPVQACDVRTIITVGGEPFDVFCYAEGTQLNLALLKAMNASEVVGCEGVLELTTVKNPFTKTKQGFTCYIKNITVNAP
jgi:hypothetical protein